MVGKKSHLLDCNFASGFALVDHRNRIPILLHWIRQAQKLTATSSLTTAVDPLSWGCTEARDPYEKKLKNDV